jgi:outer membrane protein insertion porin family
MGRLLIILMLAAPAGFSQAKKAPPQRKSAPVAASAAKWPIESLVVEGNRAFSKDQVLAIAGLKAGQMAGRADFDAARDRLVASGAFETVSYRFVPGNKGEGYVATFQVSEIEQVYPVDFEDLHVSSKELREFLRQKDPLFAEAKLPATQPVLTRYAAWIEEFLAAKDAKAKVTGVVEPSVAGGYGITFRPAGERPKVAQVTFEGNQALPQNVLREGIAGAGIGAPYSEDSFRLVLNASIRPLYERNGRVRVAFPQLRAEPTEDVKGLHVFVTVDEGPSYQLGKVEIEGSSPLDPEELLKKGEFKSGEVANFDKVKEGMEAIRKAVRHAGYMDAKVTSERKIDDVKKVVDVAVSIDAGPQYTMGKLAFVGLDLHGEAEMKRVWGMPAGKPFNPDYPEGFLKRVRDMFDNLGETKAETKLNSKDHTVDVTLTFGKVKPAGRGRGGQ